MLIDVLTLLRDHFSDWNICVVGASPSATLFADGAGAYSFGIVTEPASGQTFILNFNSAEGYQFTTKTPAGTADDRGIMGFPGKKQSCPLDTRKDGGRVASIRSKNRSGSTIFEFPLILPDGEGRMRP